MRLSDYLRHYGDASRLARKLGVKPQSVYRWRDGVAIPRKRAMSLLIEATGGKVRERDFYRDDSPGARS